MTRERTSQWRLGKMSHPSIYVHDQIPPKSFLTPFIQKTRHRYNKLTVPSKKTHCRYNKFNRSLQENSSQV